MNTNDASSDQAALLHAVTLAQRKSRDDYARLLWSLRRDMQDWKNSNKSAQDERAARRLSEKATRQ